MTKPQIRKTILCSYVDTSDIHAKLDQIRERLDRMHSDELGK
jgi:low affinity Fe/Cu permease